MTTLVHLLHAVRTDARAEIDAFLAALKLESANTRLEELSARYPFKTFWDGQAFDGNRVMLAQDLAEIMYDTKNTNSLGSLIRRYGLDLYTMGTSTYDTWKFIKTHFNLSRHTNQQSFATYSHFLMAGMKGETELAQDVCAYLLKMEEEGRVREMLQVQQEDPSEILRRGWLVHDKRHEGHDKRFEIVEQDVKQAKVIAINAQHATLILKKAVLNDQKARLKRAQTYLPGEAQAYIRGRLYQFAMWHCLRCKHELTLEINLPLSIEIDEVFPRTQGGNRTWKNIQALCRTCNNLKKDAAERGEYMGLWDFRTPLFRAACEREQQAYDRKMSKRESSLPLFSDI